MAITVLQLNKCKNKHICRVHKLFSLYTQINLQRLFIGMRFLKVIFLLEFLSTTSHIYNHQVCLINKSDHCVAHSILTKILIQNTIFLSRFRGYQKYHIWIMRVVSSPLSVSFTLFGQATPNDSVAKCHNISLHVFHESLSANISTKIY